MTDVSGLTEVSAVTDARGGGQDHAVVSREAWLAARTAFLAEEKRFTRLRDELSRQRRELPWVRVDKEYVFDGPSGKETLAELFDGRSQLIVYHFMFSPAWDEGCKHCSFWADNFNGIDVHLTHRDVSFVAISRAPLARIEAFKRRMGWSFKWVSSFESDFNFDYQASFTPEATRSGPAIYNYATMDGRDEDREGCSVFYRDEQGAVFHTYSCYARGIDMLNGAYHYLDLAPKGRDEDGLEFTQSWVEYHDRYED
ncbi:MAG TPA: thioredoxin family protein [Solirubrobacteraceae bacterium]